MKNKSKKSKEEKMKSQKAITLVALVVTIIILLILAGITITQLNENGLLKKSRITKQKYEYSTAKEIIELELIDIQIDCKINKENYTISKIATVLKDNNQITIEKYFNSKTSRLKTGVSENLVNLEGIVVSVDQYPIYKFLIGGNGKIDGILNVEITDETAIEDFNKVQEFEENVIGKIVNTSEDDTDVDTPQTPTKNIVGLIPTLTSNKSIEGEASGINVNNAYYAFDGNDSTYTDTYNSSNGGSREGEYIQYIFNEKVTLTKVETLGWRIKSGGERNNTEFKRGIYITEDGENWTLLYEDNDYVSQNENSEFEYELTNPIEIKGIRFSCKEVKEDSWGYNIYRAQCYGYKDYSPLIPFMTSDTSSTGKASGNNVENAYYAFDGNNSTYTDNPVSSGSREGEYIQYIFNEKVTLKKVKTLGWRIKAGGGRSNTEFKRGIYITEDGENWRLIYVDEDYVSQNETSEFEYKLTSPIEIKGIRFSCYEVKENSWGYNIYSAQCYE